MLFREFPSTSMGRNTLGEEFLITLPIKVGRDALDLSARRLPIPTETRYDKETWDETPCEVST